MTKKVLLFLLVILTCFGALCGGVGEVYWLLGGDYWRAVKNTAIATSLAVVISIAIGCYNRRRKGS